MPKEELIHLSQTKLYQIDFISREIEQNAYEKYSQRILELDRRNEDLKIKIVGNNEDYTLEEAFQLLAGVQNDENKNQEKLQNSQITARSIHQFLEKALA